MDAKHEYYVSWKQDLKSRVSWIQDIKLCIVDTRHVYYGY